MRDASSRARPDGPERGEPVPVTLRAADPGSRLAPADRVRRGFEERFGAAAALVARAPGRVNLIGDHTDYNDGFVLPMTIDRAVYVALRRRKDDRVRLVSLNFGEQLDYDLQRGVQPAPGWARYVAGVVEEVRRDDEVGGFEAVIYGDVPVGAGLSSSAALEMATAVGLDALFELGLDPVATARLGQRVEHHYVGVQCGIMDQFVTRLGRRGDALFLDCRSLAYEHVPMGLGEVAVVVVDSGASRELAGSAYNERRRACREGVERLQASRPSVQALRDVTPAELERHGAALPEPVRRRCRHVVTENQRVLDAVMRLREGGFADFGALMTASHVSLRDDYEVSSPELDLLVEAALEVEGVLGARLTGAGFGGCTVNLVRRDAVAPLRRRLVDRYRRTFGRDPAVHVIEDNLEAGAF